MKVTGTSVVAATNVIAMLALSGLSSGEAEAKAKIGDGRGSVALREIARLDAPTHAAVAPGKTNRKLLFVTERAGTVRVIRRGHLLQRPFLDIGSKVGEGGERGLLSIAFDPGYAKNRRFYVYFTDNEGDIRVSQFQRSPKAFTTALDKESITIEIAHPDADNHNGGTVTFGPDGYLYLGTGDGGGSCDSDESAQSRRSLLGKLLRVAPRAGGGYSVPKDNPFGDEIYALGLRNPFRFSFDGKQIAIGDVGQSAWEEVDYISLGAAAGANFGWDAYEGTRLDPSDCGDTAEPPNDHRPPIFEYPHSGSGPTGCSITGGHVVRDRKLRSLWGRYLYADFCVGELRSFVPKPSGAKRERALGRNVPSPTSIVAGARNQVYVTSLEGPIYRLR